MTVRPSLERSGYFSNPEVDQSIFREQGHLGSQGTSSVTPQPNTESPMSVPSSDNDQSFFKAWGQRGSYRGSPVFPRPNADIHKPLPSTDGDQSFFRTWALRGSHRDSSEDISPGTSPTPGFFNTQRKTRKNDQNNVSSETSSNPISHSSELIRPIPRRITPASLLEIDGKTLKSQISSDSIVSGISNSTTKSAISNRTQILSKATNFGDTTSSGEDRKPSRKPRPGYKWYRGITGSWSEAKTRLKDLSQSSLEQIPTIHVSREPQEMPEKLGRQNSTKTILSQRNSKTSISRPVSQLLPGRHSLHGTKTIMDQGGSKTSSSRPVLPRLPGGSDIVASINSISIPREGLYLRTKRRLGFKKPAKQSPTDEPVNSRSMTGDLLYETSRLLHEGTRKSQTSPQTTPSVSSSTSDLSIAGVFHRRQTGSSKRLDLLAGSLRGTFRERGPFPSPNPEAFYTGSDRKQHFIVEMSQPNGPCFLPSEARKVGTPPLPSPNSVKCGRIRGFFFDYNAPGDNTNLPYEGMPRWPIPGKPSTSDPDSESDWFRTEVMRAEIEDGGNKFELHIPEHFPNSPLCPKHPKHASGGRGVCVYHGRNVNSKGSL